MFCHRTEKFLRENGVDFTTRDVLEDEEALAELERIGAFGTPATVIDDEEVVFGFDRKKLEQVLRL